VLGVTVTAGNTSQVNATVEVRDGASLSSPLLTPSDLWGRQVNYNSSLGVINLRYQFNYISKKNGTAYSMQYSTQGCIERCNNGRCLRPGWRCNGINQCGDFSDELGCTTLVNHVPGGTLAAAILASLVGGALLAVCTLLAITYYRKRTVAYGELLDMNT